MDFPNQYFTPASVNKISKKVHLKLGIPTIDERLGAVTLEQVIYPDTVFVIEGVKGKKNKSNKLTLKIKQNKMSITRDIMDGSLIANMNSLCLDNSIENFRSNAEILIAFADFKDIVGEVLNK